MACNCGKNKAAHGKRRYPGFTPQGRKAQGEKDARTAQDASNGPDKAPSSDSLTAGGGGYELVSKDGSVARFGSRLQADAARVRAGYRGTVRRSR